MAPATALATTQPVTASGLQFGADTARILGALAPATQRAYQGHWRRFLTWAEDRGLRGTDDRVLADYIRAGRENAGRGRGQAPGVRWASADTAARIAETRPDPRRPWPGKARGLRDAALIAVMSDGLLRVSEAAALAVGDVRRTRDGSGRLSVRRSKTDQGATGSVLYIGPPTMHRIRRWLSLCGNPDSGPLFRRVRRRGHIQPDRLTMQAIRAIIRARCAVVLTVFYAQG